jgi:serine/threonine protein kinase
MMSKLPRFDQYNVFLFLETRHFLVLELLSGGHLEDRVHSQGPYTFIEASQVAKQLCSAVSLLHQKEVAHLSIKPEHVLLESFDDHVSVRLAGFGSARAFQELNTCSGHQEPVFSCKRCYFLTDDVCFVFH